MILPLIDIPGNISGLADTNVFNTQLDTGQMEMTTIAGAVRESGAIDVVLEQREQDNGDSKEVEEGNCNNPQLKTGETELTTNARAVKDFRAVNVTLKSGEQGQADVVEVRGGAGQIPGGCSIQKCHQGTQTELTVHVFLADVGDEEPVEETRL